MKMKVNARRTEFIEVDIDEREINSIVRSTIRKLTNLDKECDYYEIEDNMLMGYIDHGGHGSGYVEKICIRSASEQDKAAVLILDLIGNY